MKKSLLIIFLLLTKLALANNLEEVRKQALDFGSSFKNSANQTINESNKVNTPGYVSDNPKETKYYADPQMQNDAEIQVNNSPQGKLLSEDLNKRPQKGKNQLGKEWGSPQAPDCVGFSADELAKLQFNKMDLSEIASDIESKVTIPDKTAIESKIKKKMEDYEIKPH